MSAGGAGHVLLLTYEGDRYKCSVPPTTATLAQLQLDAAEALGPALLEGMGAAPRLWFSMVDKVRLLGPCASPPIRGAASQRVAREDPAARTDVPRRVASRHVTPRCAFTRERSSQHVSAAGSPTDPSTGWWCHSAAAGDISPAVAFCTRFSTRLKRVGNTVHA